MRGVTFGVPAEVAFDFLVDPRNRPDWQSSLRRVALADASVRVGQTWVDVTSIGARPAMETTVLERPTQWTERGVWRAIEATLTLRFTPTEPGCVVTADISIIARGVARPLAPLLRRAAALAVPRDLERAARIFSASADPH
jgi:uncharacterized protein YndB with AHSA1/START domain